MLTTLFWFIIGLIALIAGAELLVRGASRLASSFGVSKLVIGLTVVAFGTSAPELAVSILAGLEGETDIMLGNVIGSNLTNILLILGASAVIFPLHVNPRLIRLDLPLMIGATVLLFLFSYNNTISFTESSVLVVLLLFYLMYQAKNRDRGTMPAAEEIPDENSTSRPLSLVYTLGGLVLLLAGAEWLVDSAVHFAEMAGVSELVIGLTIVAGGTSLPELTTAIVASIRRERELVISSVVGSNLFNILAVLGIAGVIIPEPIPVQDSVLGFDLLVLLAVSFACIPIFFTGHRISRGEGLLFVGYYSAYVLYLWLDSTGHSALPAFSSAMLVFVAPVTGIAILLLFIREWRNRKRVRDSVHKGQ